MNNKIRPPAIITSTRFQRFLPNVNLKNGWNSNAKEKKTYPMDSCLFLKCLMPKYIKALIDMKRANM